jgi:outer membrane protein assembly factor BamB
MKRTVIIACCLASIAADWPQFRGPAGNAVSPETNLPTQWTKSTAKWAANLPGRSVASPVVAGGIIYVSSSSGFHDDRLHVNAFDAKTGAALWHRQMQATGSTVAHPTTCMAAPTPVATTDAVYCLFATGDLAAYAKDGTLLWYRSLVGDYPTITNQVGMAASPLIVEGKLIVPMDNAGESFLAALDLKTGKNIWKVERKKETGWTTPVVRNTGGTAEILFPGRGGITAYNAGTGEKLWTAPGLSAGASTATIAGEMLYLPGGGVAAHKFIPGGTQKVWATPQLASGYSSPVIHDGIVYAAGKGVLAAADATTGKVLWKESYKGTCSASPVVADGKVYVTNETGTIFVFQAGKEAELLATNALDEETLGTPAFADGRVFVRTRTKLYAFGQ